jgi:hypothetical protein
VQDDAEQFELIGRVVRDEDGFLSFGLHKGRQPEAATGRCGI